MGISGVTFVYDRFDYLKLLVDSGDRRIDPADAGGTAVWSEYLVDVIWGITLTQKYLKIYHSATSLVTLWDLLIPTSLSLRVSYTNLIPA